MPLFSSSAVAQSISYPLTQVPAADSVLIAAHPAPQKAIDDWRIRFSTGLTQNWGVAKSTLTKRNTSASGQQLKE
ncbi:hypothetical protein [Microcoleus sp. FACHB-68]|uniref:hypothetical protein n=1 Tax=Microcoleus sp. FACHB-68 TaxID=2692826 RepID=UPI0019BCF07D|nr:hypothetical protein [Microcoleus sp. FACHB-68]MBD1939727.1 hypothetical protein [Microcoleus sp. FACHB-68]